MNGRKPWPSSGMQQRLAAAVVTPGCRRMRSMPSSTSPATLAAVVSPGSDSDVRRLRRCVASKPGFTFLRLANVRSRSTAPTSRITARATSAMTRYFLTLQSTPGTGSTAAIVQRDRLNGSPGVKGRYDPEQHGGGGAGKRDDQQDSPVDVRRKLRRHARELIGEQC